MKNLKNFMVLVAVLMITSVFGQSKPNILVFWGDDVGMWNISAYHNGMMGVLLPTLIVLLMKELFLQMLMPNRVVLLVGLLLFWDNICLEQVC